MTCCHCCQPSPCLQDKQCQTVNCAEKERSRPQTELTYQNDHGCLIVRYLTVMLQWIDFIGQSVLSFAVDFTWRRFLEYSGAEFKVRGYMCLTNWYWDTNSAFRYLMQLSHRASDAIIRTPHVICASLLSWTDVRRGVVSTNWRCCCVSFGSNEAILKSSIRPCHIGYQHVVTEQSCGSESIVTSERSRSYFLFSQVTLTLKSPYLTVMKARFRG